jgi:hypothetical protein
MTQELRKLAKAATVGVWKASGFSVNSKEHGWATIANTELDYDGMAENAAYIAAANPAAILALLDERDQLQAENERLKADRERDAFRLVWSMNWMRMSVHDHGFTKHVLERGGTADYSDCATYIDKCTTAPQEAAHGIHAKGGQQ